MRQNAMIIDPELTFLVKSAEGDRRLLHSQPAVIGALP